MLLVHNLDHINPSVNLAIEEYCLNKYGKQNELFMLYTNDNAVIVGKNQNVWEEINTVYTAANNIPIIRRISGGGTVFHDLGNLVFSFIVPYDRKNVLNFGNFLQPICNALNRLGLPAHLNARNDIYLYDFKISGNAQYNGRRGIVTHGTLLFNSNLQHLAQCLTSNSGNISSKSLKSVRSKVGNISWHYPHDKHTFKQEFLQALAMEIGPLESFFLDPAEWQEVHALALSKYNDWNWNYAKSPTFDLEFNFKDQPCLFTVEHGLISSAPEAWCFLHNQPFDHTQIKAILRENLKDKKEVLTILEALFRYMQ